VLPEVDSFGGRYLAGSSIFENGKATVGGGLYYYNARYYDPDLGRFIQADSKLDGLNRYAYCHNNPIRYTDPTGDVAIVDDIIGIAAVAFTYFVVNYIIPDSWREAISSFLGGATIPVTTATIPLGSSGSDGGGGSGGGSSGGGITGMSSSVTETTSSSGSYSPLTLLSGQKESNSLGDYLISQASEQELSHLNILEDFAAGEITDVQLVIDVLQNARGTGPLYSRSNFRSNLADLTGVNPFGYHAHHVFPVAFQSRFQGIIDVNNPKYGSWWESSSHLSNARAYNNYWRAFFRDHPDATYTDVLSYGRLLAGNYGFSVNY
jgi:RHS repeat-associated protein